jgi:hypothetical protein
MLGSGDEFRMAGSDGAGDKGEDGAESEKSSDVSEGREYVVLDCTVFPLLHVRSEVTDGFRRNSLGYFSPKWLYVSICTQIMGHGRHYKHTAVGKLF